MASSIVLSKGTFSVEIHPFLMKNQQINKMTILPIPQVAKNQSSGPKDVKILDLLRLTHTIIVNGYLTATASKTAKEVKDDLFSIIKGGGEDGGTVTLTYDGDSYEGYIEKVIITEKAQDDPVGASYSDTDHARYEIILNFIEGVAIGV